MAAYDPAISKAAVSLHASAHLERDQTDLYQEMIRWYDHFGLKRRDGGELPDHLSIMLEFLQFVTAQEHANAKTPLPLPACMQHRGISSNGR